MTHEVHFKQVMERRKPGRSLWKLFALLAIVVGILWYLSIL